MRPTLLSAFRHPLILASIALLALNDQVLKSAAPSWLTGKLSDFAGLFFFPILLGALAQVAAPGLRKTHRLTATLPNGPRKPILTRRALQIACFAITGLVFAGVKTVPEINAAVTRLFPYPAQIILDPTDLLALVMFWPAWVLWDKTERQGASRQAKQASRWAYLALGAASLASLATAPCPSAVAVVRLAFIDSVLYAGVTPNYQQQGYTQVPVSGYRSTDQGKTWTVLNDLPPAAAEALTIPAALPITACDPQHPQVCYRISTTSPVETSSDAGKTWQVRWQIPPGRDTYMDRAAGKGTFLACWKTPDKHPYDMLIVPGASGDVEVIAMGNEGILRQTADGTWERIIVDPTRPAPKTGPTPFYASDPGEAIGSTGPEFWSAVAVGLMVYLGISLWAWIAAVRHPAPGQQARKALWPLLIVLVGVAGYCVIQAIVLVLPEKSADSLSGAALTALGMALLVLPLTGLLLWYTAGSVVAQPGRFRRLFWAAVGSAFAVFAVAWLPFIAWAFGMPPYYAIALTLSVVLALALLVFLIIRIRKGLHRALAAV